MTALVETIELPELIVKYKLKKEQLEKEYGSVKKENYKHRGCCMEADVKARMEEVQVIYSDLLCLNNSFKHRNRLTGFEKIRF